MKVNRLSAKAPDFEAKLDRLLQREMIVGEEVSRTVSDIIADVKTRGDAAVIDYTNRFDKFAASSMADLEISQEQLHASLKRLPDSQVKALQHAAERIRRYHDKQKQVSWHYDEPDGSVYGQKISPLEKVGVYAPGGKANYPSSILMLAIPAQVAGVKEIIADQQDGLLYDSIESFERKVEFALRDDSYRKKLGEAAQQKIREKYSWNSCVE